MKDAAHIGTSATNALGMTNAMNTITLKMVYPPTGVAPSPFLNASAIFPINEFNTLADILAACINTVDTTSPVGQSSICQSILSGATVNSVTPTNTLAAALNLAQNPTIGLSLFSQGTPTAPYQPTLGTTSAPTSWTLAINYNFNSLDTTPNVPKGIAIDPTGYVYSVGAGNSGGTHYNSLLEVSPDTGTIIETHYTGNTIENQPSALAIDTAGDIWTTDSANNSIIETGPNAPFGGGGIHTGNNMSAPNAIAIDAAGNLWVTNSGNSSVSEFNSAGTAIGNFTSGITSPVAIAISPK
jgi:streptogramin lyase